MFVCEFANNCCYCLPTITYFMYIFSHVKCVESKKIYRKDEMKFMRCCHAISISSLFLFFARLADERRQTGA